MCSADRLLHQTKEKLEINKLIENGANLIVTEL